ncbi:hypothetical protein BJX61DRAFT_57042 [Aspergillus egyptiacus]|nr:hypothetical protein BJX61DRAFT_57042 [Aspergillus egyptiacus]
MANPTSSNDEPAYMRALKAARNGDKGALEGQDGQTLTKARDALWHKVNSDPNYLLDRNEFALFNYYRRHYEEKTSTNPKEIAKNKETVRKAVARFWDNHSEDPSGSRSSES